MARSNSCCPNDEYVDVRDFSTNLGGARGYLERTGIIRAARNPRPLITPSLLTVHTEQLKAPYPTPSEVTFRMGEPAPDRAETGEWPYTEDEQ